MLTKIFGLVDRLDHSLSPFFTQKLPSLPKDIRQLIAKYSPYLILIITLLSLFSFSAVTGLFSLFSAFFSTAKLGFSYGLFVVTSFLEIAFLLYALPGLFSHKLSSWKILYFITIISLIQLFTLSHIFQTILSAFFCFYFLYQIKPYFR